MTAHRFSQFVFVAVSLIPLALQAESSDLLPPTEMLPPGAASSTPATPMPAGIPDPAPAAMAPATSLPAIDVTPQSAIGAADSALDATAPAPVVDPAPAAPTVEVTSAPAVHVESGKIPSTIKNAHLSIFFTPFQIHAMGDALNAYETSLGMPVAARPAPTTKVETTKIDEPATYPVFYLSSIAYRASNDWSIWVSGRKITSSKNGTTLKILSVTPEHVVFGWEPTYKEAIAIRTRRQLFAPTDAVKNRLTKTPTFAYDEKTGALAFTLKANQSFTVGYMNTFEGFVPSPTLPTLDPVEKGAAPTAPQPKVGIGRVTQNPESEVLELRKPASVMDSLTAGPGASRKEIDDALKQSDTPKKP